MAKAIPFTLFQVRGIETRNRSLRFDMNAMADFESTTGMGLAQLMSTNAVFAATRALLWAGLRRDDRGITLEVVGNLMQKYCDEEGDIKDLLNACLEACIEQKAIPGVKKINDDGDDTKDGGDARPSQNSPNGGTSTGPGPVTSDS